MMGLSINSMIYPHVRLSQSFSVNVPLVRLAHGAGGLQSIKHETTTLLWLRLPHDSHCGQATGWS